MDTTAPTGGDRAATLHDQTTAARPRSTLRAVALPTEHGGWGLTLEPGLLGVLVAPSAAGGVLAVAALLAFVARTPLKLVLVDRWRHRRLPRTAVAELVALAELAVLAGLAVVVALTARGPFWVPLLLAVPLVGVELWFDMRSRSRRLLPELAGTVGIGAVVAAIVLADDGSGRLAAGLWLVVAARAVASVPFARDQIARAKGRPVARSATTGAQVAAVAIGGGALLLDPGLLAGFVAVSLLAAFHMLMSGRTPPAAAILGIQQMVLGLVLVLVTWLGVRAS